ncbi:MAG: sugar transferase [Acidobacteriota bacterium]
MAMTEFSERIAHFPAARPFREIWDRPIEFVGWSASSPPCRERLCRVSALLKRSMDVALAMAGIVMLGAPMLLVALLIKLESGETVFYRSQRLGLKGRRIRCTKFRTMAGGSYRKSAAAADWSERERKLSATVNDVHVTRVGQFLRKYSLDAVPQLFDVLRGEMSIVGPRPPMASELDDCKIPHLRRLDVKPGMTGLWQVQPIHDPSLDSYFSVDQAYVQTWSPWLDVKILAKTIAAALADAR